MKVAYPKKISLVSGPTPIEPLKSPPDWPSGLKIFLKRDDLTSLLLSGNKARKLEFIATEVIKKKADTLITCGGIQSNHARATAILATQMGLKSHLVLRGKPDTEVQGNLFLDKLVGAEIKHITPAEYEYVDRIMEEEAEKLRPMGRNPYIIPEGASSELGVWGYVKATLEILSQLKESKLKVDRVVCAIGSGGTYAGLFLGSKAFGWKVKVTGFNVCYTADYFKNRIGNLITSFLQKYRWKLKVNLDELDIIDGYVGDGYARSRLIERELIAGVARSSGIVLDPVYTGKAMLGLIEETRRGIIGPKEKVLFLHSGGIYGLFPIAHLFYPPVTDKKSKPEIESVEKLDLFSGKP
ncbi:MAG: D-cysteine desulfhydrase family protein [Limisphaerales bacterium]